MGGVDYCEISRTATGEEPLPLIAGGAVAPPPVGVPHPTRLMTRVAMWPLGFGAPPSGYKNTCTKPMIWTVGNVVVVGGHAVVSNTGIVTSELLTMISEPDVKVPPCTSGLSAPATNWNG
jgi:hypothetical protein